MKAILVLLIVFSGYLSAALSNIEFTQEELEYLKNKNYITMCINPDWMPYEKIEDGKHIGITADYFEIFEKDIGIPIKLIKTTSWEQSIKFAKSRKCDILSLAMQTKSKDEYMNFTAPYLETPVVLATRPSVSFLYSLSYLKDEKVGIVKNYAINELVREKYPNINVIDVKNTKDGLQKVANGELYGYIGSLATIGYMFQTEFIGELKISGKFDDKWEFRIAVRNDDALLLSILDKSVKNLSNDKKQEIWNKYISINYEKGFDYHLFWEMLAVMTFVILIILMRYKTTNKYRKKIEKYLKTIDNYVLFSSSDLDGNITHISSALCKRTGYTKKELIGKNHSIFRHKDTPDSTFYDLWNTIKSGKDWSGEIKNRTKDGGYYWAYVTISTDFDEKGKAKGYTAIRYDITDKKKLEQISITDALTQIPNRLHLDNTYDKEFKRAARYGTKFSVIILDIDHFKNINDTFGHKVGDDVLILLAKILKDNIRDTDVLGRWGGEEFLIISPETNIMEAEKLANKMKNEIEYFDFPVVHSLTCSFGVSQFNENDKKEDIFKRADKALFIAKKSGRNRVVVC